MSIVGGLDVHRQQITVDFLDTATGEVERGQVRPADRAAWAAWLRRRFGDQVGSGRDVDFAVEGCTGWRYVTEELARAGCVPHLADPAETAAARGPKRRAKTDRADARLQRELLAEGRLAECWIPPAHILDGRALLECYHALREQHSGWQQRIHAVLFHHGAPSLASSASPGGLLTEQGRTRLAAITATQLSPAGQVQVRTGLAMLAALEVHLDDVHQRIKTQARRLHGARVLQQRLYGVGPLTAFALVCWLAGTNRDGTPRFSSTRKAVRFTGLDITVYSSAGKRSPGYLSRQGPAVLRWAIYEAGTNHARRTAPDHAYYARVKDDLDGKRAGLSEARKLLRQAVHILNELGDDALTITWTP